MIAPLPQRAPPLLHSQGGRARYGFTQAGGTQCPPVLPPPAAHKQQQGEPDLPSPAASAGSLGGGTQHPHLTLAQELQGVLDSLSQPHEPRQQAQQAQQPPVRRQSVEEEEPGAWRPRPRRSGSRRIAHTSPAVPTAEVPPPAGSGPASGGRRWARAQAAAAAARSPAMAAGGEAPPAAGAGFDRGGDAFFSVDQDLMQAHAQRQQGAAAGRQQGRRAQQGRAVQWESPRAPAPGPGAHHTPLQPSQRANPLAALLSDAGGSSAAKPRAATTGGKARGRHPIYGAPVAPTPAASQGSQLPSVAQPGSTRQREQLGLRDAPATSPRQAALRRHAPQPHSRFAIRDPAAVAVPPAAAQGHQPAAPGAAGPPAGLQQLIGEPPGSGLKQPFHPRPQRAPQPDDRVEEDDEGGQGAAEQRQLRAAWGQPNGNSPQQQRRQDSVHDWQRQDQGHPVRGADTNASWRELEQEAADGYRTPRQPLRRSWLDEQQQQQQAGGPAEVRAASAGPAAAPPVFTSGGSCAGQGRPPASAQVGSAGRGDGGRGMSLQRQFIAQLRPVSSSTAAATMQQQKQRLAGAAGLHARMQAILAAEKAAGEASPAGGRGADAGPRLTVLQKELEGSITKCLCRCVAGLRGQVGLGCVAPAG